MFAHILSKTRKVHTGREHLKHISVRCAHVPGTSETHIGEMCSRAGSIENEYQADPCTDKNAFQCMFAAGGLYGPEGVVV